MKVNRLEAHDRFLHLTKQEFDIGKKCQELINQRPFFNHDFYIFAHARTIDIDERIAMFSSGKYKGLEDVPSTVIIWQPRLTKPKAEPNSMLFKAHVGTDVVDIIWILPKMELWEQYEKGKMLENKTVVESIERFKKDRFAMEAKEPGDLSDEQIHQIYCELSKIARDSQTTDIGGV